MRLEIREKERALAGEIGRVLIIGTSLPFLTSQLGI
jgi:hypothetical protein